MLSIECPVALEDTEVDSVPGIKLCFAELHNEIAKWHGSIRADYVDATAYRVGRSDLPSRHLEYFDAWTWDGSKISIDMAKARDIHRHHMRCARASKLAALDI